MISHKSIATLGIGFGTLAVASIGMNAVVQNKPQEQERNDNTASGFRLSSIKSGITRDTDDDVMVLFLL